MEAAAGYYYYQPQAAPPQQYQAPPTYPYVNKAMYPVYKPEYGYEDMNGPGSSNMMPFDKQQAYYMQKPMMEPVYHYQPQPQQYYNQPPYYPQPSRQQQQQQPYWHQA